MKVVIGGAVALALVAGYAYNQQGEVEVVCGPQVSTPVIERGLDVSSKLGDLFGEWERPSKWEIAEDIWGAWATLDMWWDNIWNHANNRPEDNAATGWRNVGERNRMAALASCCPVEQVTPDRPEVAPEAPLPPPIDPKILSMSAGSTAQRQVAILQSAISVRKAKSLDQRADLVVAITGLVESEIANLDYGDRDSLGWLQQRPSQGWGSPAQVMDVRYAAAAFFDALVKVPSWETRPVGEVAQAVQRSAYPDRYADRVAEAQRLLEQAGSDGIAPATPDTPNINCPAQATLGGGTGDVSGPITQVATLSPGPGNSQAAVHDGPYWYVLEAQDARRRVLLHRLDANGRRIDSAAVEGAAHATSFAVRAEVAYVTFSPCHRAGCSGTGPEEIRSFPYRPGRITKGSTTDTGWRGQVSMDPAGGSAVVRRGNSYKAYTLPGKRPMGVTVVTEPGQRQGFSISGQTLYVATGATNAPARLDAFSFASGEQTGTRDITALGADVAGSHRELEGAYGNVVFVKVETGADRQLLAFSVAGGQGGSTPKSFDQLGNPRTVDQAIAQLDRYVSDRTPIRVNMCSRHVARAYGWPNSGSDTALTLWRDIPAGYKHPGQGAPPRGALVFWKTGAAPGHIAISAGEGMVYSTDVPTGRWGLVPIEKIDRWGPRQGWSEPFWPAHSSESRTA